MTYLILAIFITSFIFIALDLYDKSIIALSGALLMVFLGVLTPEEAVSAIDYETILLLIGMMVVVNIAAKSGIFAWLNVRIASLTRGNPLALFSLFSLVTAVSSAFLDNVSTVLLIVPLTIELVRGMGRDPKPYIFAEIIFANLGGGLTLIGDASNIIIGGASGLNFMAFIRNLWLPILASGVFALLVFIIHYWRHLRPISTNLADLFVANILIRKIQRTFLKVTLHKDFIIKVITVLLLTFIGFFLQGVLGLPTYVIAFAAAIVLALTTQRHVDIHESLKSVEWTTLFFFAGLFIMVAGVEKTGILHAISQWVTSSTADLFYLSLIILWVSGLVSMLIDNIPFVTIMVPVVIGVQHAIPGDETAILWWALSLGACLGGSATLIGGSANVVAAGISRKSNVHIGFFEYMRFSLPLTIGILCICSVYLFFRTT